MPIRQVMLATDFSPAANAAAEVARGLATELNARLHIVHVVPPLTDPASEAERLEREVARLGITAEPALLRGQAGPELLRYAREKAIDLIVVASHGRTGFSHALLGSVAEQVVRLAPCFVLSVPATFALRPGEHAVLPEMAPVSRTCLVCAGDTDELICSACRERIRGEALVRKVDVERAGRRG
jgi:universal stress protein A